MFMGSNLLFERRSIHFNGPYSGLLARKLGKGTKTLFERTFHQHTVNLYIESWTFEGTLGRMMMDSLQITFRTPQSQDLSLWPNAADAEFEVAEFSQPAAITWQL